MSAVAIIIFLIGSGLLILGAFFLTRLLGYRNEFGAVVSAILPVVLVICVAAFAGNYETVVSVIWGTVAFNLGLTGVFGCMRVQLPRTQGLLTVLWLSFGWLACMMAGKSGAIGKFSGFGLIFVGIVVVWQACQKKSQVHQPVAVTVKNYEKAALGWRQWLMFALAVGLVIVGARFVVGNHMTVASVLSIPVSLYGLVVLAPICAVPVLMGLRYQGQWQTQKVLANVTWVNVLVVTFGLGLVTVAAGALHLTQSVLTIVLPWVAGMTVLSVVKTYLPQKTARWLGGLIVIMFCGMIMSLFW